MFHAASAAERAKLAKSSLVAKKKKIIICEVELVAKKKKNNVPSHTRSVPKRQCPYLSSCWVCSFQTHYCPCSNENPTRWPYTCSTVNNNASYTALADIRGMIPYNRRRPAAVASTKGANGSDASRPPSLDGPCGSMQPRPQSHQLYLYLDLPEDDLKEEKVTFLECRACIVHECLDCDDTYFIMVT